MLDSFGRRSMSEQRPHRTSVLSGGPKECFAAVRSVIEGVLHFRGSE